MSKSVCPFCGEYLRESHGASMCACGYIETSDMTYDDICLMFSNIEDSYDDCPF